MIVPVCIKEVPKGHFSPPFRVLAIPGAIMFTGHDICMYVLECNGAVNALQYCQDKANGGGDPGRIVLSLGLIHMPIISHQEFETQLARGVLIGTYGPGVVTLDRIAFFHPKMNEASIHAAIKAATGEELSGETQDATSGIVMKPIPDEDDGEMFLSN